MVEEADHERRKRLRDMPVNRLFPNMVTVGGLCCGASAIRFAMLAAAGQNGMWEIAIAFLMAAAVLDAMDGMVARLLKATSNFGAQLDSLSDVICFGVSPALVFYLWALSDFKRFGWSAVLFYIVCCALRLARFNASIEDETRNKELSRRFFTGVPAPGGALLAVAPIMASFYGFNLFEHYPQFGALYLVIVGLLMASRIPTFAAKGLRINQDSVPYVMLAAAFVLALFVIEPWLTLVAGAVGYILSMPFSAVSYHRQLRKIRSA